MKRFLVFAGLLAVAATLTAQQGPPKSPPATELAKIGGTAITITYASPRVNGRAGHIFSKDGLISHDPHYPVWRAGANSATILQTDGGITLGKLSIPAGKYTLFVDISDPDNWILIVNKQTGQWGLSYDPAQDLGKVKMTMSKPAAPVENLKYTITSLGAKRGEIKLSWENHTGAVPIQLP